MATKRIGIDARLLAQTGVGVYIKNLLTELKDITDENHEFFLYIRPEDKEELPALPKNTKLRTTSARWHSISEQTVFLKQLVSDNLDLMHFTYFSMPIFYNRPFVITIHDVIPFTHATGKASTKNSLIYRVKLFVYKKVLTNAVNNAKRIFVPTNAVKKDIEELFPLVNSHVLVKTYEGIDIELMHAHPRPPKQTIAEPFFLYMGNYYPHKNVEFLITAFEKRDIDAHLILCGPNDFFAKKIDAAIKEKSLEHRIVRISNTTLEERAYLYSHAIALIHPSKNEGFGLPLLEAAYFGCPAIVSDIPVFREVRPNAMFFRIGDMEGLAGLMEDAIEKGKKRSKETIDSDFSFKKMATDTYNQYKQCI